MKEFLSPEIRRNPFSLYAMARAHSPILNDPATGVWLIFDYDGVKRALNDHDAFSNDMMVAGRPRPDWLIFFDPPRHTQLRGIISSAFTPRMIAGLEARIREVSRDLLDTRMERGEMDLAADYSAALPTIVIAEMLGVPAADWPRFRHWSDVILRLSYVVSGGPEAAAAGADYRVVMAEMMEYLPPVIERRRREPADDLLSRLAIVEVEGQRMSDFDITQFVQLLLVAGQETTANLVNNAMLCFMDYPDELARLRGNPDLLPSAIEEVLRFRSPFQWTLRASRKDVEINGQTIPAGKVVLPVMGSANRDARVFDNADRFQIDRDPNPHVAFGHGIHFCLGAALSRLEARIALTDILQRMRTFELATAEPWEPRKALHVHGPTNLPIRFEPARSGAAPA